MADIDHEMLAQQLVRAIRGGRSQTAFSRRLGYKSNVAYSWESGRRWPTAAETLRSAERSGLGVVVALQRFGRTPAAWNRKTDPTTPSAVAEFMDDLRGSTSIAVLARRCGKSRFSVGRWLSGQTEPKLPDFLNFINAASMRLVDFVTAFVEPDALPAIAPAWQQLQAQRRLSREKPWTQAVARTLELAAYKKLVIHKPGWIAERLGISESLEREALEALAVAGQIHEVRGKWVVDERITVDTRRDAEAGRRMRAWTTQRALEAIEAGADGLFSYNVFTVSRDDLDALRELHKAYFRQLRTLVSETPSHERVVVANVQLFALDAS